LEDSDENDSSSSSDEQGSSSEEEEMSLQTLNPQIPKTFLERESWARLIIILEQANLETCKTGRGIELINCDDH
jgi:rRNA small subunit pseudouridine methyltransferase Nep1